jgi:hypothetical protein
VVQKSKGSELLALDLKPGVPSAADAGQPHECRRELLWLPQHPPKEQISPDSFGDPAFLLRSHQHAVVRWLITISLLMLAFGVGIVMGRAGS